MMSATALRRWSWVHKWTSLVCTVFMLLLCLTGLPLIFHHEIDHLLGNAVEAPVLPDNAAGANDARASLDQVLATAQSRFPQLRGMFAFQEADDEQVWFVTMGPSPTAETGLKQVAVDARTGLALAEPQLEGGVMGVIFSLHVDLFAGLPGKLFLGLMGVLMVLAIVSGVVLYAPFMRKLDFGTVRRDRSTRTRWLDLHNLLGIVTLVWALAVGATGVLNTWAELVIQYWQFDQLSQMVAPYKNQPAPPTFGSLEAAAGAARALEPQMKIGFIAFPGTSFSSPHHYAVFMRGTKPLTARLFKPVLVDATTGQVTDTRDLPWYVTALLVSKPLHFGDYGGRPMQILWALLDVATIVVLGSGLYLWLQRRPQKAAAASAVITRPAA